MPKPVLTLIAAVARNGVIGIDNRLPWQLPADLKHFKELTTGHTVIMGRKTWESLPDAFRPLPGRLNIVVSRNAAYQAAGGSVVGSLPEALSAAGDTEMACMIGGAELYRQALPLADRLILTEIDQDYPGDAFFPAFTSDEWIEVSRLPQVSATGLPFAFVTYERRR